MDTRIYKRTRYKDFRRDLAYLLLPTSFEIKFQMKNKPTCLGFAHTGIPSDILSARDLGLTPEVNFLNTQFAIFSQNFWRLYDGLIDNCISNQHQRLF